MQAIAAHIASSHCTVFALRSNGRVEAVSTASAIGEVASLTAAEYLRMGFDKQDSNMVWLSKRKPGQSPTMWLSHQLAQAVANEQYRRICYGETGIRERLSLLAVQPDGYRVAISFYRNHSFADYRADDFEWMDRHARLILAAVIRHTELSRPTPAAVSLNGFPMRELPRRERELISHVLAGMTTKAAASEMGISETTALTYRYRAFRRLGITSHRELLAQFSGFDASEHGERGSTTSSAEWHRPCPE